MMWTVVGHERALAALARSLSDPGNGRLAHAYLLTGPAHVGKRRLALDLAKAVNCLVGLGTSPPCGNCRACRRIENRHHPDVEVVHVGGFCDQSDHDHARDGSKDIKICQIRRLERMLALRPYEGRYRVVLIDPAEALNVYAADALLKTLEEPPPQVEMILLAADPDALPETVVSRTRRIALGPVPAHEIEQALIARGADAERAALLARLSGGRIGWALTHAADPGLLQQREERLQRLEALLSEGRAARMRFAAELASRFATARDDLFDSLELWQSWWRDLLLVGEGCEDLIANSDRLFVLRQASRTVPPAAAVRALEALCSCRRRLEDNANARLALEVLVLRLPSAVRHEEVGPGWSATSR